MLKKRSLLIGITAMLLLTLATYWNHFNNTFHFDDFHTIVNNASIRSLKNVPIFFSDGSTSSVLPQNQSYRPVTTLSLAIDYWLAGDYYPSYFQVSSFILFLLQGVLMVLVFTRIFDIAKPGSRNMCIALFAATWYMLHPANAETVNYIIARSDIQSTLAVVAGFALYLLSPFCRKSYLYLLIVGIGALSKPTAVMFAPMLFCYILLFEEDLSFPGMFKKSGWQKLRSTLLKTLPAFVFCAAMYWFIDRMTPKSWIPGGQHPLQYLATQPFVILHYFTQFFVPAHLSADTDWQLLPSVLDIRFFSGCLFVLALIMIAFYTSTRREWRPVSFGIAWFFLALIPTSSIIPLAEVLNDHRMFFPFVGLMMSVCWTLGLLAARYIKTRQLKYLFVPVLLLFAVYAYGTYRRNQVWHTEDSLWYDVTQKSPGNARGIMNYALAKLDEQDYQTADRYLQKAIRLNPVYPFNYTNMGITKEDEGDTVKADYYYRLGVELGGGYPDPPAFYGAFLVKHHRYDAAELILLKAIRLSPAFLTPRVTLMQLYDNTAQWDKLRALARQTLRILPQNTKALEFLRAANERKTELDIEAEDVASHPAADKYIALSRQYYNASRYTDCIAAARSALQLNPKDAEAWNNIGAASIKLQLYPEAVMALKKAVAIKPDLTLAHNNLVAAAKEILSENIPNTALSAADYIDLSLYYFNQKQYEQCIGASNAALALKPGYDLAYNNICAAYVKLGKWDEAIAAGKKGLLTNPGNRLLTDNLAEAEKGKRQQK